MRYIDYVAVSGPSGSTKILAPTLTQTTFVERVLTQHFTILEGGMSRFAHAQRALWDPGICTVLLWRHALTSINQIAEEHVGYDIIQTRSQSCQGRDIRTTFSKRIFRYHLG